MLNKGPTLTNQMERIRIGNLYINWTLWSLPRLSVNHVWAQSQLYCVSDGIVISGNSLFHYPINFRIIPYGADVLLCAFTAALRGSNSLLAPTYEYILLLCKTGRMWQNRSEESFYTSSCQSEWFTSHGRLYARYQYNYIISTCKLNRFSHPLVKIWQ